MRIVQVIPSLDVGGAERIAALLALELRREGHDLALVSLFDPTQTWIEGELRDVGIALHFLGKRPGLDARVVPRLARTFARLSPDVIHTHLHALKYTVAARLFTWRRPPVVHTVHNLAEREAEGLDRRFSRLAFRSVVEPVAIGQEVARSIRATYGFEPRWSVPNGIVVRDFTARPGARESTRDALGIAAEVPVLLTVGRLNEQKNYTGLLDAFADPRLADRGALLLIAGDGDLRGALEAKAAARGIATRVRFLGIVSNVPDLLAAADAFVLSSHWEGNPLVVMEAMAAGRPVAATSVGCIPELVSPDTGRLVPPGDMAALADALVELTTHRDRACAMGRAGEQVARSRFDVSTMARAYRDLYQEVLADRSPGPRRRRRGPAP